MAFGHTKEYLVGEEIMCFTQGRSVAPLQKEEKEKIRDLQELETEQFRVVIPSSLEERFARRFLITPGLGNVPSCDFSVYSYF